MGFHFAQDKFWNPTLIGWTPILQPDKWIHLFEFAWVFSVLYLRAYNLPLLNSLEATLGPRHTAGIVAWLIGFLYEIIQGFRKPGFSYYDLKANTIGIGTLWLISN